MPIRFVWKEASQKSTRRGERSRVSVLEFKLKRFLSMLVTPKNKAKYIFVIYLHFIIIIYYIITFSRTIATSSNSSATH